MTSTKKITGRGSRIEALDFTKENDSVETDASPASNEAQIKHPIQTDLLAGE